MIQHPLRLLSAICCLAASILAVAAADSGGVPNLITLPGISFSNLPGPNQAPYSGHTEGDFTVTPTAGSWYQAMVYGDVPPSIYAGPINSPVIGVLQVTDNVGPFDFGALRYSSNNGESI